MALAVVAAITASKLGRACHVHAAHGRHLIRQLQLTSLRRLLLHNLGLPEGLRVSHQNVLLGVDPSFVKLWQIIAARAGTGSPTVSIVGEALTVQLQALRPTAVARLVGRRACAMDGKASVEPCCHFRSNRARDLGANRSII